MHVNVGRQIRIYLNKSKNSKYNIDLCNPYQTTTTEPQIEDTHRMAIGYYGKETHCTGKFMHK